MSPLSFLHLSVGLMTFLARDKNCGAAFSAAADDYALGLVSGCGARNPVNAVQVPTSRPVCTVV